MAAAIERFGHVDLLHNHAGIAIGGDPPQIPLSEWERVLRVNLISQVRGVMTFLPHLEAGGGGHVVNTASGLGVHADDPVSAMVMPYAVSKKAIVGFTQYLAMWLPQRGVGVSLLAPDLTDTNLGRTATLYGVSAAEVVDGVERAAAVIQSPEEVGEALVEGLRRDAFLISMAPAVAARLRREADVLLDPTALLTDGE